MLAKPVPAERPVTENTWSLLAGVRFFLASIVVLGHTYALLPTAWAFKLIWFANFGANQAVTAFLFISGLSIAHSVDRQPIGFYQRRFYRIAPVYILSFALAVLPWAILGPVYVMNHGTDIEAPLGRSGEEAFILNFFCLQGWATEAISTFIQSWTIGCEVFYYALAPLFNRLSSKKLILLSALSFALYLYHANTSTDDFSSVIYGVADSSLLFIWLGGFLYYRYRNNRTVAFWLPYALVIGGTIDWNQDNSFGAVTLLILSLAVTQADHLQISNKARRVLNTLGGISYPLYMTHFIVVILAGTLFHRMPPIGGYLTYIVTVAVASLIYFAFDLPIAHYSKRRMATT